MFSPVLAEDASLSVCQNADGTYQFTIDGAVDGWAFYYGDWFNLETLQAGGDGVELVTWNDGNSQGIFGYPDAPRCSHNSDTWKPGAPSIPIEMYSDCGWIEINNHDGGWSRVESNGVPVLLHYGEALIGSHTQTADPANFRAIETECPG
jgi:hypothetical protein